MKPITYYCDNETTQFLSEKWGDRLERMQPSVKKFLISLIGNALFLGCSVADVAEPVLKTPHASFVIDCADEIKRLRYRSDIELTKILGYLSSSLAQNHQ